MDGPERDETSPPVDGSDFLSHLRAAGDYADKSTNANQQTIGRSNQKNPRQDFASMEGLFSEVPVSPISDDNNLLINDGTLPSLPSPTTPMKPDGNPVRPGSMKKHERLVSWGVNSDISSIGHRRQLTLDNMSGAGPFVEEAESNIIRALEQHRSQRDLRYASDNLLSQVPETMAHDFSNEPPPHQTESIRDEHKSNEGEQEAHEDRRPLIRSHRRTMTVEDKLAGLTDAMSAMQTTARHDRRATLRNERQRGSRRSFVNYSSSLNENDPQKHISSGDAFAENASRLTEERSHKAKDMWGLLLKNLPALREEAERVQSDERFTRAETSSDSEMMRDEEAQVKEERTSTDESNISGDDSQQGRRRHRSRSRKGRRRSVFHGATDKFKEDLDIWHSFFRPRKDTIWTYTKSILFYAIIPLLGVAACLFYLGDNPLQGRSEDGSTGDKPSISWWLIYIVRQLVTFSMALAMQGLIIDFLALGTRIMIHMVGPVVTLLVVQAKGWAFICFWWGIFDFAMLTGTGAFARNWLFWQETFGLFNEQNPSGHVVDSDLNRTILTIVVVISAVVAVKRFVVGLYFGRQTFHHYGQDLAKVMNKMLLISEVAGLARAIERAKSDDESFMGVPTGSGGQLRGIASAAFSEDRENRSTDGEERSEKVFEMDNRDPLTGSLRATEKEKLMQLLGRWEDPSSGFDRGNREIATISAVLKFRKALTLIQRNYPFSFSFGPAETREACIESAQRVYDRLLLKTPSQSVVQFETLALVALSGDGKTINQMKAKDLVKVFRPDRGGNLSVLDFIKSVDTVYKEYRLLLASIDNSSQIDRAFENIINIIFYTVAVTFTLSGLGYNPLAMFLSLSSIILAFAFMIGSASSKYFEGVLFILVRRPYNIGDRIHVSNIERDTSFDGAPGWTVEHVTLFETIARWLPTNEQCSLSNGSLANSRIINWARSTQAQFHLFLKLPIDTPYERIVVLKNAIEQYLKARPREWLAFNGFRANKIETDKAYIEYVIVVQHRDSWQNIGQVLDSKANLSSYIREVTGQLGMDYKPPSMPVDLKYTMKAPPAEEVGADEEEFDENARMQDFKNLGVKHNIRLG